MPLCYAIAIVSTDWESAPHRSQRGVAHAFTIKVNDVKNHVDFEGYTPPLWMLRDILGMTGTMLACGMTLFGT